MMVLHYPAENHSKYFTSSNPPQSVFMLRRGNCVGVPKQWILEFRCTLAVITALTYKCILPYLITLPEQRESLQCLEVQLLIDLIISLVLTLTNSSVLLELIVINSIIMVAIGIAQENLHLTQFKKREIQQMALTVLQYVGSVFRVRASSVFCTHFTMHGTTDTFLVHL